jgi:hypothetical protein
MSLFITFVVASSALYIAKVAEEEMVSIFAGMVALLSFVLSLILAPWYVQLSILILVSLWQFPHR